MKQIIFILFLSLVFCLNIKAQDSESFGELIPYPKWLADEIKKNRGITGESFKPKKFNAIFKVEPKLLSNAEGVISIEIQTTSEDLVYADNGGIMIARMSYFGRIISNDYKFDSAFEEMLIIIEIPVDKWDEIHPYLNKLPVIYRKSYKLPKGKYTINFAVNNLESNEAKKKLKFEIK